MDEVVVRGLIIGGAIFIIAVIFSTLARLLRSESEGARRLRLVLKVASVLALVMLVVSALPADRPVFIGLIVVCAVGYWIWRGFKPRNNHGTNLRRDR